jgi:hypothetical protein
MREVKAVRILIAKVLILNCKLLLYKCPTKSIMSKYEPYSHPSDLATVRFFEKCPTNFFISFGLSNLERMK